MAGIVMGAVAPAGTPISDGFDYPVGIPDGTSGENGLGYYVIAGFGDTSYKGIPHLGEDWNSRECATCDLGDPVYAISNGFVRYARDTHIDSWKGVIIINHISLPGLKFKIPNEGDAAKISSMYAHLNVTRINEWVYEGEYVRRGQLIGVIGPTPAGSTGPHLHFEIRNDTSIGLGPGYSSDTTGWIDPRNFINANRPQIAPLIGDWNGNNIDTTGTFDPRTSSFSLDNGATALMGEPGDLPLVGDWDGSDGKDTIGVYRPKTAQFFLDDSNDGIRDYEPINLGVIGDFPIVGDWDGDGDDDIGVFRSLDPVTLKTTFFLNKSDGSVERIEFGQETDIPIIGDWDNDGIEDIGVFRRNDPEHENNAVFYLKIGTETIDIVYGNNDDIPIVGKWDNDGLTKIGVYRPSTQQFIFNHKPASAQWGTPTQLTHNSVSDWGPSISGDGSKIAFQSDVKGDFEIFVINSDGTGLTQLTHNTAGVMYPSISGDGSKIAFHSHVDGDYEIFVINSDGTGLAQLTHNTAFDMYPSISGDGSKIAFLSTVDGDYEIIVINSDGTGLAQLTHNTAFDMNHSISGDGSKIAFLSTVDGDWEIFVINSDGTGLSQLTHNTAGVMYPSISDDGSKITFHSHVDGDYEIFVINSDGTDLTQLTHNTADDTSPSISGDGSKIAFLSTVDGDYEIFVINSDGTGLTQLTYNSVSDWGPSISADGSKIAFNSDVDGDYEIFLVSCTPSTVPPTCAIKLKKNGIPIDNINVGDSFDIYVGDSTDDHGIKEVRFSSDESQDGNPTGEWTDWYDWDTSLGDWDAANKIKAWSFATPGDKEVLAEVKDGGGQTDKDSANINANQLPIAKPVITSPLEITPIKDIYYVGDNLNAEFTITNSGGEPVTFDVLTVGGRLNGWCPTEGCPDFTHRSLSLQPGESYLYEGALTLTQSGNYHFFIAYYITNPTPDEKKLLDENNWNTCVEFGEGLTHTDRIKNIIALEEEISSPDTVSELRDRINHNLQRQVKYPPYLPNANSFKSAVATVWASVTSWITQTHLIEKYDEFYQTGIDYDCLRFKALKDARDSLDRGDIVSAKKYLQKSYTYEKMSVMSFGAAAEVFENNLEAGEILAEGIKDGCEASVNLGLGVTNPVAAKAADYVYILVDYAVDRELVGEEQAAKNAVVNAVVTTTFNEIKFGDLGDRTIADYTENRIGKVTFPMLQKAFQNNENLQFALSKIIKECGVEIEEAVAEDIAMHIRNELEHAVDFKQIEAKSPVEVQVYGSHGEVTGLLSGTVEHGIPRSLYCKGTVTILYPLDSYRYDISGTDEGTYGLDITSVEDGEATIFTATDIPTAAGAIHEYSVDGAALSQGGEGVTVQVDSDGDGTFEHTFTADNELTQEEFLSGTDGEPIPEFTTIAIPVAIVLGLIFIISRRKRKR
jgi:Tol biopolymer transport system component